MSRSTWVWCFVRNEVPDAKFSTRIVISRSCEIREARSEALRRSSQGMPEVNSRNGDAPADTCLLSPRASHGMKLLLALAYAATVGYACLWRHASERASERAIIPPGASAGSRQGIIRLIAAAHRVLDGLRSAKCDVLAARSNRSRFISIALISCILYLSYLRFSNFEMLSIMFHLDRRTSFILPQIFKLINI